jgi:hypothetical protein
VPAHRQLDRFSAAVGSGPLGDRRSETVDGGGRWPEGRPSPWAGPWSPFGAPTTLRRDRWAGEALHLRGPKGTMVSVPGRSHGPWPSPGERAGAANRAGAGNHVPSQALTRAEPRPRDRRRSSDDDVCLRGRRPTSVAPAPGTGPPRPAGVDRRGSAGRSSFAGPGPSLGTFLVPSAGPCGMLPRRPCPAFQRRSSWLDQASVRRALAEPPAGRMDASATAATYSLCSPEPSVRSRLPPSAAA